MLGTSPKTKYSIDLFVMTKIFSNKSIPNSATKGNIIKVPGFAFLIFSINGDVPVFVSSLLPSSTFFFLFLSGAIKRIVLVVVVVEVVTTFFLSSISIICVIGRVIVWDDSIFIFDIVLVDNDNDGDLFTD